MTKPAILLIGPTGSGKTPLGNYIADHGIKGKSFVHFDFGELLRRAADGTWNCNMSKDELTYLKTLLAQGALLEKETFYLAKKIILFFNNQTNAQYVLLNGLPRHVQQAQDISPYFKITGIIHLNCTPDVVVRRIALNSGKDRTHRTDDNIKLIEQKLTTFVTRTTPLINHFKQQDADIVYYPIEETTQPEDIHNHIERSPLKI